MLASLAVGAVVAALMMSQVVRHVGRQTGAILLTALFVAFGLTLLASRMARWLLAIGTVLALVPWPMCPT